MGGGGGGGEIMSEEIIILSKDYAEIILSHNNPRFPCNIAITNFLILYTCEIRFHDVIHCTVYIRLHHDVILRKNSKTWPNEYVLDSYFSI